MLGQNEKVGIFESAVQGTLGKPGRHLKQVKHLKQVGGDRGFSLPLPIPRSPTSYTFVPLCLPTPTLHCVAPVFKLIKKPGFNFQTVPKLNIFVHFLAFVSAWDYWVPVKVITGHDL